jgi:hypothetical protein
MKSIDRRFAAVAVTLVIALGSSPIPGETSVAAADARGDLGDKIAGTYLAVQDDGAQVLQINGDGNLSVIFSLQFTNGGVVHEAFSDTLGSWSRTGRREITARTADLAFRSASEFLGVGAATYVIEFDRRFQTAIVTCEGAIYPPGVNPFDVDAEPIAGTEFTWSASEFHRIPMNPASD